MFFSYYLSFIANELLFFIISTVILYFSKKYGNITNKTYKILLVMNILFIWLPFTHISFLNSRVAFLITTLASVYTLIMKKGHSKNVAIPINIAGILLAISGMIIAISGIIQLNANLNSAKVEKLLTGKTPIINNDDAIALMAFGGILLIIGTIMLFLIWYRRQNSSLNSKIVCHICNAQNNTNVNYCGNCGNTLNSN